jgi:hypothetical protein
LSVASQNQWREDGTGHASRSSGLLRLEASHARVFQSGLKTDRGAMVDDARCIIAEVTCSSSRRWTDRCDELRQTLLLLLYHILRIRP